MTALKYGFKTYFIRYTRVCGLVRKYGDGDDGLLLSVLLEAQSREWSDLVRSLHELANDPEKAAELESLLFYRRPHHQEDPS